MDRFDAERKAVADAGMGWALNLDEIGFDVMLGGIVRAQEHVKKMEAELRAARASLRREKARTAKRIAQLWSADEVAAAKERA